jgi:hypothetical protein
LLGQVVGSQLGVAEDSAAIGWFVGRIDLLDALQRGNGVVVSAQFVKVCPQAMKRLHIARIDRQALFVCRDGFFVPAKLIEGQSKVVEPG